MIIYDLLFYIFAFLLVSSAIAVVSVKNSVHSVFYLIFAFFNVAGLFVLLGAEFLAMALVIVYVGAVAILFLFVVMMLNVGVNNIKAYTLKHRLFLIFVAIGFLAELILIIYISVALNNDPLPPIVPITFDGVKTNTHQIGLVLYTNYAYLFQICGFILFAAVIAAITLTLRPTRVGKTQDKQKQLSRNKGNSITLVNSKTGAGTDARE